jgi:hypothetical protein
MAESGVAAAAARRSTGPKVAGRLQRVQEALGRALGRAGAGAGRASGRVKQLLGRFGKAQTAAENVLNARRGGPAGGR